MRFLFIVLIAQLFLGCSSTKHIKSGRVLIESSLSYRLFTEMHDGVQGGSSEVYIDSVLVYKDTTGNQQYIVENADIKDVLKKNHPMNFCEARLSGDTLFIELRHTVSFLKDKLTIWVVRNKFFAKQIQYLEVPTDKQYHAVPLLLTFKFPPARSKEVFGDIAIEVRNAKNMLISLYKGPFTAIIK